MAIKNRVNEKPNKEEKRCEWCEYGKVPDYESYFMTCDKGKRITCRYSSCDEYMRCIGADDNRGEE